MKIIRQFSIVVLVMVGVLVAVTAFKQSKISESPPASDRYSHISPITEEWVEKENGKALRVTYGNVVLEIPNIYKPNQLTKKTKSIIFPLFWPSLTIGEGRKGDDYLFRVMVYPKEPHTNYDQKRNIDWLLNNSYQLRQSIEYPPLLEYWSDKKKNSYYFTVDYKPKVINKIFGCSPDFRQSISIKENSILKMGDTSCTVYGVIADTVVVRVRFDARLLINGSQFHQAIDQLISSFVVNK